MDFPIHIDWLGPLSISGASGVIFSFLLHLSMKFMSANSIAPDEMPHSLASHLGLHFLPMSHK